MTAAEQDQDLAAGRARSKFRMLGAYPTEVHSDYREHTIDALGTIMGLRTIQSATEEALDAVVRAARADGHSWQNIANQLGISKQAAHTKYSGPPVNYWHTPTERSGK